MRVFLDNNYTFSIIAPMYYIITYILTFTKKYFEKKIVKIVYVITYGTVLIVVSLLYIFNLSESYIQSFIFRSIVPLIYMTFFKLEKEVITNIDKKDKFIFYGNVLIGILIMFIPGSKWYSNLISHLQSNEYLISEILVYFCGIITIFLNKYTFGKILKVKKQGRISNH